MDEKALINLINIYLIFKLQSGYLPATQALATMKTFISVQTQTDVYPTPERRQFSEKSNSLEPFECCEKDESIHSDYLPSSSTDDENISGEESSQPQLSVGFNKERKFIIFFSSLLHLLSWCCCPACGHKDLSRTDHVSGTLLIISLMCKSCGKLSTWHSQPYVGNYPSGNILLSAATLFAGSTIRKTLKVLQHIGVAVYTAKTFFSHQKDILHPVIKDLWTERQAWILASLQGHERKLVCGGDGRADSPGHSAKYGTYTIIELQERCIIDLQIVQVGEGNCLCNFIQLFYLHI